MAALESIDVDPSDALFVGDDIDTDIAGGGRIGMRTAPLSARQFTVGGGSTNGRETQPDRHLDSLHDVINIVIGNLAPQRCA